MPNLGVTIAVINADQILLTRREDFEVWCLPGGAVDPGESLAQAAVRETREETGLEIELTRLVGVYSRPSGRTGGLHLILFAAQLIGGSLAPQPGEVIEMGYFSADALPQPMLWGHHQQAIDALAGAIGRVWIQNRRWPFVDGMTREELYAMRDSSGLSRQAFYLKYFPLLGPDDMRLDVDSGTD